jgi:hypothetical protein
LVRNAVRSIRTEKTEIQSQRTFISFSKRFDRGIIIIIPEEKRY